VDEKELGAQGASTREKKRMKCKVPNQRSTRGFKGDKPSSSSKGEVDKSI
jgi:hypothetical protein